MAGVRIRLRDQGPLVVEGEIELVDSTGEAIPLPTDKPVVALCRCGQSTKKPFCDGSHRRLGPGAELPSDRGDDD